MARGSEPGHRERAEHPRIRGTRDCSSLVFSASRPRTLNAPLCNCRLARLSAKTARSLPHARTAMTSMFGNLPPHEKQAFFSILDEYFESRPHLLLGNAQEGGDVQEATSSSTYTQHTTPPAPAPRRVNPPPAPAARKPVVSPMPSAASRSGPTLPSGIVSGKVRVKQSS